MLKIIVIAFYTCCLLVVVSFENHNSKPEKSELDDLHSLETADFSDLSEGGKYSRNEEPAGNPISRKKRSIYKRTVPLPSHKENTQPTPKCSNASKTETHHRDDHHHRHHTHRYTVAKFDFQSVSIPFYVSLWLVCACIAKIVFHFENKLSSNFPESCLLILLGIVAGGILYGSKVTGYEMEAKLFFFYLLPPIILEAGYFLPTRAFFDNLCTILLFAVVGTLFNTACIGFSLYGFGTAGFGVIKLKLELLHCLVFAALISAVDPVAVLIVFEEIQVNEMLHIVVLGESLLNDAVTVVLYHMFETFSEIEMEKNLTSNDFVAGAISIVICGLAGSLVGFVFGLVASVLARITYPVPVIEPLVLLTMGYMSYITAEMFHFSGIMACIFCGMTLKHYAEANICRKSQTTLRYCLKLMEAVSETIIFMFLGLSTWNDRHDWDTSFVLLTLLFCLVYRCIGVVALSAFANIFRANKLTTVDQFVMAYGGLRGAIAFSLVALLSTEVIPQQKLMFTTTVVVIFFTVFVQGVTIKPLVKLLDVKKADNHRPSMNEKVHERMIDHFMAGIEDITGHLGHHQLREKFQRLDNKYLKPILLRKSARKMRDKGFSILQVHRKLTERDAEEYVRANSGLLLKRNSMTTAQSILDLIKTQSECSFDSSKRVSNLSGGHGIVNISGCDASLDMRVLQHQSTKKSRDDSRIHHILDDSMFKHHKKVNVNQRNLLPSDNQHVFHHKSRYHLRKLLHPHYHVSKKGHQYHTYTHSHRAKRSPAMSDKNKNVSFGDLGPKNSTKTDHVAINMQDCGNVGIKRTPPKPLPPCSDAGESDATSSDGGIVIKFKEHDDEKEADQINGNVDAAVTVDVAGKTLLSTQSQLSPQDSSPAAIELSLPWKRTVESTPLSSLFTHKLLGDDDPAICEPPSWIDNYSYTSHMTSSQASHTDEHETADKNKKFSTMATSTSVSASDRVDPEESGGNAPALHCDPEQFHTEGRSAAYGRDQGVAPLPPSCSTSASDNSNANTADNLLILSKEGNKQIDSHEINTSSNNSKKPEADESEFSLPLPWVSNSDICMPRLSFDNGSNVIPAHLPQVHTAPDLLSCPDDDQLSSCHLSESNEAAVSEDNDSCIPPPWRQSSTEARRGMPVISPSASFEMDSLQPQPSSQSQRLSEVASHHSEPYLMHHHLIDLPPRPPVDYEITTTLESLDIEDGQMDYMGRVQQWLLSNNPEEQEPLMEDFVSSSDSKNGSLLQDHYPHSKRDSDSSCHCSGDHCADETNM